MTTRFAEGNRSAGLCARRFGFCLCATCAGRRLSRAIRTTKSIMVTRPIYHKRDETIRGHVFCSFLALSLKFELEGRMREAGLDWEWAEIIRGLNQLREVEATLKGKMYILRSTLTGHAHHAIKAPRVAIPPVLREPPAP